jgi:hypothetical protein
VADYGIKVTKAGKNVDSTDPRDYNLWSKYAVLKDESQGSGTFTSNSGNGGQLTINHGLGYNPLIFFYKEKTAGAGGTDSGKKLVASIIVASPLGVYIQNDNTDLNNIYVFFAFPGGGDYTFDYYYHLLYDKSINT